jgi:hypothetical protein
MSQEVKNFLCMVADNGNLQEEAHKVEDLTDVLMLAGKVNCDFDFQEWQTTVAEVKKQQEEQNKFFRKANSVEGHISGSGSISNESRGLEHFPDSVKS